MPDKGKVLPKHTVASLKKIVLDLGQKVNIIFIIISV